MDVTHTFPGSLEEEPDHQDLQDGHSHHHNHFNQAEIEDPLFSTPNRAKVAVFSCPEILLHSTDSAQLSAYFEDRVLEGRMLFRAGPGFLRQER